MYDSKPSMETILLSAPTYYTRIDKDGKALVDDSLRQQWLGLLEQGPINDPQYATPQWAAHQLQIGKSVTTVSVFRADGSLAGISSLLQGTCSLPFKLKRKALCIRVFQAEHVMGMLLTSDDHAGDRLLATIRNEGMRGSDCLYFESLWVGSNLWLYLHRSEEIRRNWILHQPNAFSKSHYIDLPSSIETYLKKFNSKSRGNLKREVKSLRERGAGVLELVRVERAEQVMAFLEAARSISRNSWQKKLLAVPIPSHNAETGEQVLSDMAKQGWLRSYLLKCGPTPCAFVLGYQAHGAYHFCETAYDEVFAKLSPGKALVYLTIEDVIKWNKPDIFYFGQGGMPYKQWFGNASKDETNVLLFKKTMRNRAWCGTHAAYDWVIRHARDSARWLLRRR